MEDKECKWTIDDIVSPDISKHFVPSKVKIPNFGFTKDGNFYGVCKSKGFRRSRRHRAGPCDFKSISGTLLRSVSNILLSPEEINQKLICRISFLLILFSCG